VRMAAPRSKDEASRQRLGAAASPLVGAGKNATPVSWFSRRFEGG
jgi:hypothetical protein